MDQHLFVILAEKYVNGTATVDERDVVEGYWAVLSKSPIEELTPEAIRRIETEIHAQVFAAIGKPVYRIPFYKRVLVRYAAAAVFLLAVATTFLLVTRKTDDVKLVAVTSDVKAPASNRATITLGDGKTVYLDEAKNGQLAVESGVLLEKLSDGQIAYKGRSNEIIYNTLTNPRGSRAIDIALSDGSHVWLNAESSIRYPIAFNGNNRTVEITGEAYFEVTHNAAKPFKVNVNGETIEDLGTKFNVNSFGKINQTTLLEGVVRINQTILKPGQQYEAGKLSVPDLESVMAWKNGMFHFDQTGIEEVMREVARWYDVEVVFESKPTKLFGGGAPRTMSAAGLFKALEETGGVHFTITDKKVIVRK
jgi:transmembrane sensor